MGATTVEAARAFGGCCAMARTDDGGQCSGSIGTVSQKLVQYSSGSEETSRNVQCLRCAKRVHVDLCSGATSCVALRKFYCSCCAAAVRSMDVRLCYSSKHTAH